MIRLRGQGFGVFFRASDPDAVDGCAFRYRPGSSGRGWFQIREYENGRNAGRVGINLRAYVGFDRVIGIRDNDLAADGIIGQRNGIGLAALHHIVNDEIPLAIQGDQCLAIVVQKSAQRLDVSTAHGTARAHRVGNVCKKCLVSLEPVVP